MAPGDRDRRADGRPEQARPRDRTGRPLPYGTTDVLLLEDHAPADAAEALVLGVDLWRQERYFEAHECLEVVWHDADPADADLWQGVIQLAVACVHVQRDNAVGALRMLDRAARRLATYPEVHLGVDVRGALASCDGLRAEVVAGGAVTLPPFPGAHPRPRPTPNRRPS